MQDRAGDTPEVIAPPPLIYAAGFVAGLWLQNQLPLPFLTTGLRKKLGLGLLGLGATGFALARRAMGRKGTHIQPTKPTTALVEELPYTVSRNPIYLSLTLFYTGLACLLDTFWAILLLPLILRIINQGVIDREERYLANKFGAQYQAYKQRVRRWL